MLLDGERIKCSVDLKHKYYKHIHKTFKSVQLNGGYLVFLNLTLVLSDFCICSTFGIFRNESIRLFPWF